MLKAGLAAAGSMGAPLSASETGAAACAVSPRI
jgi:hypothetical protein